MTFDRFLSKSYVRVFDTVQKYEVTFHIDQSISGYLKFHVLRCSKEINHVDLSWIHPTPGQIDRLTVGVYKFVLNPGKRRYQTFGDWDVDVRTGKVSTEPLADE